MTPPDSTRVPLWWGLVAASGALAVYVLRLDHAAGLIVDDAWYVVLAKALAEGEGYRLISSGAAQILPAVPPGFPLLLSTVFGVHPEFPANVPALKAVSIAAMSGVGAITYRYLAGERMLTPSLAGLVALATILTPAFVFLATSTVMAECVFTLGQIGAVWLVDRASRMQTARIGRRHAMLAGLVAGAAFLIRSAGIASIAAGVVLLCWRRRWTSAAVFGLTAVAVCAPWFTYAAVNAPTAAERMAHGGAMAYSYADLLHFREGGVQQSGRATPGDVATRIVQNLTSIFGKDAGAIVLPTAYRGSNESGQEVISIGASRVLMAGSMGNSAGTYVISILVSLVAFVGFVAAARQTVTTAEVLVPLSVAMIALVPSWSFRYTLTLTPFILYYFVRGLVVCVHWLKSRTNGRHAGPASAAAARIALLTVLGLHALDHAQYLLLRQDPGPVEWLGDAAEADALFEWMNANLTDDDLVASTNPGLVYLRTGRRTVASDNPSQNWRDWRAMGVRYMVTLRTVELPPGSLGYDVRYLSPRRKLWIIELPPVARPDTP